MMMMVMMMMMVVVVMMMMMIPNFKNPQGWSVVYSIITCDISSFDNNNDDDDDDDDGGAVDDDDDAISFSIEVIAPFKSCAIPDAIPNKYDDDDNDYNYDNKNGNLVDLLH